jgi:DNA-binding NtrC family response regulator
MLNNASGVISMAACPQLPHGSANEPRDGQEKRQQTSRAIDILIVSDNATLSVYLAGLFQNAGWTIARTPTCTAANAFLRDSRAAVVVCDPVLPDGRWHNVAAALSSLADTPALIVVGDDHSLLQEVLAFGGFDVLIRPLRESDVVWTIASAWHTWMKRIGAGGDGVP